jgi:serine/threonine protein kinase
MCRLNADLMLMGSPLYHNICGLCAELCTRCAESCETLGSELRLKVCAGACRRCAESCYEVAQASAQIESRGQKRAIMKNSSICTLTSTEIAPALFPSASPCVPELPPTDAPQSTTTLPENVLGKSIGNFKLMGVLGQGGMGTVYLGKHTTIDKQVAIKTLKPEFSSDQELITRFFREATLLSLLKHPGIVKIYDCGTSAEFGNYLIMERLEGESLQDYLQREVVLSPRDAIKLICQLLDVLATVHGAGVLHRDLKPSNIYLVKGKEGLSVRLLDFGLSKFLETPTDALKTVTGFVMGTPAYISPEQAMGRKNITAQADLYAVGMILFEMVTGRRPFLARTPQELLVMHQIELPPLPSAFAPGLPSELERIILHCLEKHPDDRPKSAQVLLTALQELLYILTEAPLLELQNQVDEAKPSVEALPTVIKVPLPYIVNQREEEPAALVVSKKEGHASLHAAWVLGLLTVALFAFLWVISLTQQ